MMFDRNQSSMELDQLGEFHSLAFGASCCERLVPNYRAFSLAHGWGESSVFDQHLDLIWQHCNGNWLSEVQILDMLAVFDDITPNDEDFRSIYVQLAINAVSALSSLLKYCSRPESSLIATVSEVALMSIELYVYNVNYPYWVNFTEERIHAFDPWIDKAPLVVAEQEKQARDFRVLLTRSNLDMEFLVAFRRESTDVGIFPVRRGLVVSDHT